MNREYRNNKRDCGNGKRRVSRVRSVMTGVLLGAICVSTVVIIATAAADNTQNGIKPSDNNVSSVENTDTSVNAEENTDNKNETDKANAQSDEKKLSAGDNDTMKEVERLEQQYDYDGAIKLLKEEKDSDENISQKIKDLEEKKNRLVPTKTDEVTHVFFHSLIVDPERGFSLTDNKEWNRMTNSYCQWFNTTEEFDKVLEQMYQKGYVLVSIYDIADISVDENGTEHVTAKDIYLPEGKIPFVLSLDDLSYYHSYDGRGFASKIVVDEDGKPTCEYTDANGKTTTGSYDCVPRLDDFIEKHPDFSYKGAKGTIALTGYNGILGYRTDYCYRDNEDIEEDQVAWLKEHPDFDWDQECEEAKKAADAIKADGWTFASHTWGHIRIGDADMDWIRTDTGKWLERVEPLIGDTDIIIFAHGQDLVKWDEEYEGNEKYKYLKDKGFTIFCNVDSSKYYVRTGDGYLRMGRRNIDGKRVWQTLYDNTDYISDLFDAASVIDPARPTDAALYE